MHDKVHDGGTESRGDIRTATGVRLVSRELGLFGQADVVEFHKSSGEINESGQSIAVRWTGAKGFWRPFPVEHKRGKPKSHRADEVQLCAQALCLEEMLEIHIPAGALFYGAIRRRQDVAFDAGLRGLTRAAAEKLHKLMLLGKTPPAKYDKNRCDRCSLLDVCQPNMEGKKVLFYLSKMLADTE
jgi:CRISPR-associated exonuclease Cas4